MPTTADYLNKLVTQKNTLADNLTTKGVSASHDETLETLVPKVLDINGGGNSFKYSDNMFDFGTFKTSITGIHNGSVEWLANGFTITATSDNCYTEHSENLYKIEVDPNTLYEVSFDCIGINGDVYVHMSSDYSKYFKGLSTTNMFTFRTTAHCSTVFLRFYINKSGDSCTYNNIKIRKIISCGDTPMNPVYEEKISNSEKWVDNVPYSLDILADQYYSSTTGLTQPYSGWSAVQLIYCKNASTLNLSRTINNTYSCWYDRDKNFISTIKENSTTIIVPTNAYYVGFSDKSEYINNLTVTPIY